ncbi:MAG: YHS domain-containing protein [Bryobacterales bacterium]|nr:YHS domain-containing protein [Bryobacterales bacterium]
MVVLSLVRSVVGFITKAYTGQSGTAPQRAGNSSRPQSSSASSSTSGGELKKDPVCGTFISTATAFQGYAGGQTYYFCSTECRDKFKA